MISCYLLLTDVLIDVGSEVFKAQSTSSYSSCPSAFAREHNVCNISSVCSSISYVYHIMAINLHAVLNIIYIYTFNPAHTILDGSIS